MADEFVPVQLGFRIGSLTPAEVQVLLDEIMTELADPDSPASREAAAIGIEVKSLEVEEQPAFVIEAFLIAMAVKFAGGAAGAGGALFFNKVIKPHIVRKRADGIGDPVEPDDSDGPA